MTRMRITLRPHTSLYVGGYAQSSGGSDGDTACDAEGLLIPGSALKGALRESALRLANAIGVQRVDRLVERVFGKEQLEGLIQVSTLRVLRAETPGAPPQPAAEQSLRHHVSLDRGLRQAAPGRLFQNKVTAAGYRFAFTGCLDFSEPLSAEEIEFLKSAARITDQLGGGRGRGLGLVDLQIEDSDESAPDRTAALDLHTEGRATVYFALKAIEPLCLGVVKDESNYLVSKDYLDGSAIRGAVAATLLSAGHQDWLDDLLSSDRAVVFGDARPGNRTSIPAPLTATAPKGEGELRDTALSLCAATLLKKPVSRPPDTRRAQGTLFLTETSAGGTTSGAWASFKAERRTITRTARDHALGRAADKKLFSLEVLDPVRRQRRTASRDVPQELENLRFHVPVTGDPSQLKQVHHALRRGIKVGAVRSRGFGRLEFETVADSEAWPDLLQRHESWARALERRGVAGAESSGVVLALGPLAVDMRRLGDHLAKLDLQLINGVSRSQAHAGWNRAVNLPRSITSQLCPGTVLIVQTVDGKSALEPLRQLEESGIGPGRPDGWGRVVACHPFHVECSVEGRSQSEGGPTE